MNKNNLNNKEEEREGEIEDEGILIFPSYFYPEENKYSIYVTDDRKIYRPKEEVTIKGWIRKIEYKPYLEHSIPIDMRISFCVTDQYSIEIFKGDFMLNLFGNFNFTFKIGENVHLGNALIYFSNPSFGFYFTHSFRIDEVNSFFFLHI